MYAQARDLPNGRAGVKYGALEGAATGVVEAQATKIIDEGRLATQQKHCCTQVLVPIGGTLGAAGKAISNKIKNKSPEEIDDIICVTNKANRVLQS